MRSTSSTFRPTDRSFTLTKRMTPSGSTMKVARSGTPLGLVEDAEGGRELAPCVGEHGEGKGAKGRMILPPREVHVVRVGAAAEHLGPAGTKVRLPPAELGDLGRADEGEVHGPEEDDEPLAGVVVAADLAELLARLEAHHGLELEVGETIANGQHDLLHSSLSG